MHPVAAAILDEAVQDARRGAIEGDVRVAGTSAVVVPGPAVADYNVVQHAVRIVAGISEVDGAPITGVRFNGPAVLPCVAAVFIVVDRGEGDGTGDRAAGNQRSSHDQVIAREELDHRARLHRQRAG